MPQTSTLLFAVLILSALSFIALAALLAILLTERRHGRDDADDRNDALMEGVMEVRRELSSQIAQTDARLTTAMTGLLNYIVQEEKRSGETLQNFSASSRGELERMNSILAKEFLSLQGMVDARFAKVLETNAGAAEGLGKRLNEELKEMRATLDQALGKVREENAQKLEAMRATVEEKLEKTLSERISASFRRVDEKLGLVETGLGEMRQMARNVARLQNILANVKTRGTFGEVQLNAILEEVLAPGQFASQVKLDPKSGEMVDFAVRLPGRDMENPCWLPIDSKFPLEDWEMLEEAERAGDPARAADARKGLERALLKQAKSIRDKYVKPPVTTEFAVMFLPSEGLYAEALRIPGLADRLQRELRITPAGPTVITALLNSLLMGFMTLAVKTEFAGFTRQFEVVEKQFREAQSSLEQMSVKSRRMGSRMESIEALADEHPDGLPVSERPSEASLPSGGEAGEVPSAPSDQNAPISFRKVEVDSEAPSTVS